MLLRLFNRRYNIVKETQVRSDSVQISHTSVGSTFLELHIFSCNLPIYVATHFTFEIHYEKTVVAKGRDPERIS